MCGEMPRLRVPPRRSCSFSFRSRVIIINHHSSILCVVFFFLFEISRTLENPLNGEQRVLHIPFHLTRCTSPSILSNPWRVAPAHSTVIGCWLSGKCVPHALFWNIADASLVFLRSAQTRCGACIPCFVRPLPFALRLLPFCLPPLSTRTRTFTFIATKCRCGHHLIQTGKTARRLTGLGILRFYLGSQASPTIMRCLTTGSR